MAEDIVFSSWYTPLHVGTFKILFCNDILAFPQKLINKVTVFALLDKHGIRPTPEIKQWSCVFAVLG